MGNPDFYKYCHTVISGLVWNLEKRAHELSRTEASILAEKGEEFIALCEEAARKPEKPNAN